MSLIAWSVLGNSQRLDGGSMFGNAPRAVWERWIVPDERHRIPLACRCLLLQEPGGRRILFETGIGAFFEPRLADRYGVQEAEHMLLANLAALGVSAGDINVVVLSHLHFDHVGGLLTAYQPGEDATPGLLFSNATYVIGERAWARAATPHARDRASFIPALLPLLQASGRVELVAGEPGCVARSTTLGDGYRFHLSEGHTPGLLVAEIEGADGPVIFASDLIPGAPWVHVPITMGYDRYPELLIDEKRELLTSLVERGGRVFFTHDPTVAMGAVTRDERGRFRVGERWDSLVGRAI